MSENKTNINWYPGHMAKTKRQIIEDLKLIDVVIEILDARIPISSQNPDLAKMINKKKRIIILNKSDLADKIETEKWIDKFKKENIIAISVDSNTGNGINKILNAIYDVMKEELEKNAINGRVGKKVRVLILGIPNVGKSSFINRISKKTSAEVGNRPGVTRAKQWVKVDDKIELLDTPGVLWPKFEDKSVGAKLALIGTMPIDIMPTHELSSLLFNYLFKYHSDYILKRYNVAMDSEEMNDEIMEQLIIKIGQNRGMLKAKGEVDIEKTQELVLREFKNGILGTFSLDILGEEVNG